MEQLLLSFNPKTLHPALKSRDRVDKSSPAACCFTFYYYTASPLPSAPPSPPSRNVPPRPAPSFTRFYEQQAAQNGLSRLGGDSLARSGADPDDTGPMEYSFDGGGSGSRGGEGGRRRSLEVERERVGMQEAASTTVSVCIIHSVGGGDCLWLGWLRLGLVV